MSIQVTLNFANEAELVAFFTGKKAVVTVPAAEKESPKSPKPAATPAAGATTAAKPETATESPSDPKGQTAAAPSAPAAAAASTASSTGSVEYAVLQKAVFALVGKKTGAAMGPILSHFEVKHMKDLAEGRRQEALDMINKVLAE